MAYCWQHRCLHCNVHLVFTWFSLCSMFLQEDVFLISSNAMQYNSPDTIYYRQVPFVSVPKNSFSAFRVIHQLPAIRLLVMSSSPKDVDIYRHGPSKSSQKRTLRTFGRKVMIMNQNQNQNQRRLLEEVDLRAKTSKDQSEGLPLIVLLLISLPVQHLLMLERALTGLTWSMICQGKDQPQIGLAWGLYLLSPTIFVQLNHIAWQPCIN